MAGRKAPTGSDHQIRRRISSMTMLLSSSPMPWRMQAASTSDPHHLRLAQHPALGREVSDEFIVPLCRGHRREVHRCGDELHGGRKPVSIPLRAPGAC